MLSLYLVKSTKPPHWDTYSSFVCVAKDRGHALSLQPSGKPYDPDRDFGEWPQGPLSLISIYLGQADPMLKSGTIICASYHAG